MTQFRLEEVEVITKIHIAKYFSYIIHHLIAIFEIIIIVCISPFRDMKSPYRRVCHISPPL